MVLHLLATLWIRRMSSVDFQIKQLQNYIEIKQEDLHPLVQGTISFSDDWKKQVEKQLIMYRDFKNMMNDDTVKEMELVMRMFKITDDDLKKL